MSGKKITPATLVLADGTAYHGVAFGAIGTTTGEVVFNTSMTGYQEILTDPSYTNQILTFTYPHIGNVGTNDEDIESHAVQVAGVVVRNNSDHYSNYRARSSLSEYLAANNIVGIAEIDTRALVLHIRQHGAQMGIISSVDDSISSLTERASKLHSMEGLDLVKRVTTPRSYEWSEGSWRPAVGYRRFTEEELAANPHVIAIDCGVKFNILRLLVDQGFRVTVVPATYTAEQIMALNPDAFFLSNGPGDPAAVTYTIDTVRKLLGKRPMFGICLGHQLLGHAVGASTFKLKFGHRGGNHPVRNEKTGSVEITVQNHGFATSPTAIPNGVNITHVNLNDRTIEGLEVPDAAAFSVQYHPESSPGPHDAGYLFRRFRAMVQGG